MISEINTWIVASKLAFYSFIHISTSTHIVHIWENNHIIQNTPIQTPTRYKTSQNNHSKSTILHFFILFLVTVWTTSFYSCYRALFQTKYVATILTKFWVAYGKAKPGHCAVSIDFIVGRRAMLLFCFVPHRKQKKNILSGSKSAPAVFLFGFENNFTFIFPLLIFFCYSTFIIFPPYFFNKGRKNHLPVTRQSRCPDPTIVLSRSPISNWVDSSVLNGRSIFWECED
jgi:hypothetical protein